jgi:hypothetical protein
VDVGQHDDPELAPEGAGLRRGVPQHPFHTTAPQQQQWSHHTGHNIITLLITSLLYTILQQGSVDSQTCISMAALKSAWGLPFQK